MPESEGLPSDRILKLEGRKSEIDGRTEKLESELSDWSESNGGMLFGGMELLERDLEIATAPVRVAVSDHAFVLDGWVRSETESEVEAALSGVCTHVSIERFTPPAHSSHHHDEDPSELPPIAFSPRNYSKPFEMLTDVMGRPAYGKSDPTFFMFLTYPLFFGLILGDMAYGLAVMGMAWFIWRRFPINPMMKNVGGFLFTIGLSTVIFGYIYGEFAGFEFLPHGHCDIDHIIRVLLGLGGSANRRLRLPLPQGHIHPREPHTHHHLHGRHPCFPRTRSGLPRHLQDPRIRRRTVRERLVDDCLDWRLHFRICIPSGFSI